MKELHISDVSVSNLFGKCDFCKHQKYIGIYGKPCVVPEPCLYETGKKNWEHNGKFPDVSDSSNFTKEEALLHLQKNFLDYLLHYNTLYLKRYIELNMVGMIFKKF